MKYLVTLNAYRNLGLNGREQVQIITDNINLKSDFIKIVGISNSDYKLRTVTREFIVNKEAIVLIETGEYSQYKFE